MRSCFLIFASSGSKISANEPIATPGWQSFGNTHTHRLTDKLTPNTSWTVCESRGRCILCLTASCQWHRWWGRWERRAGSQASKGKTVWGSTPFTTKRRQLPHPSSSFSFLIPSNPLFCWQNCIPWTVIFFPFSQGLKNFIAETLNTHIGKRENTIIHQFVSLRVIGCKVSDQKNSAIMFLEIGSEEFRVSLPLCGCSCWCVVRKNGTTFDQMVSNCSAVLTPEWISKHRLTSHRREPGIETSNCLLPLFFQAWDFRKETRSLKSILRSSILTLTWSRTHVVRFPRKRLILFYSCTHSSTSYDQVSEYS